jgi:hypothetical protein
MTFLTLMFELICDIPRPQPYYFSYVKLPNQDVFAADFVAGMKKSGNECGFYCCDIHPIKKPPINWPDMLTHVHVVWCSKVGNVEYDVRATKLPI